jgi:hypothetical protein
MEKKPYTPPTITEQGNAVHQTRGMGGKYWEPFTNQAWSHLEELD